MRTKMIAAAAVLLLTLLLCWYANDTVRRDTEAMRALAMQVSTLAQTDMQAAQEPMDQLQRMLDERRPLLEVLTLHEVINRVSAHAVEARAYLTTDEFAQFTNAIEQVKEDLTVLYEQQRLSWSNLF